MTSITNCNPAFKKILIVLGLLLANFGAFTQTLPVGLLHGIEDAYRRQQLMGNDTSLSSFMIRPLNISTRTDLMLDEASGISISGFRHKLFSTPSDKVAIYTLPVVWQNQVNSHHPYGMNDGSMIQAKGYQTQLSAGVFAKIGPLSIQLRPEFVYAANSDFKQLHETEAENGTTFIRNYANYYNTIDLPERFGDSPYSRASWGQSSIRLTFDPVSVGISNENLWWGPGNKSSLLMSNNASGFKHITLNTSRPVKTYIGSFEGQIVAGRLENSGVPVPSGGLYNDILSDWRYFSGMVVSYQPKWVPNLYLGFDRSFVVDKENIGSGFSAYLPIFSPAQKKLTGERDPVTGLNEDDLKKRDQYISFFTRWVMPESNAEIYFQYGRNDHAYDLRDAIVEPEHSRAYLVGFLKLIPLKRLDQNIQIGVEIVQMERSKTSAVRAQPTWYRHGLVRGGYTNTGQVLGAGVGPGGNMQSIDISWVNGLSKVGIDIERIVHNNDLFYQTVNDARRNWVDLAFGGKFDKSIGHFLLNAQLKLVHSYNYNYGIKNIRSAWDWDKQDANNLNLKVGILYNW